MKNCAGCGKDLDLGAPRQGNVFVAGMNVCAGEANSEGKMPVIVCAMEPYCDMGCLYRTITEMLDIAREGVPVSGQ